MASQMAYGQGYFRSPNLLSVMWKLWYARNQIIFNQANPFPPEIANAERDFVVDFNEEE